MFNAQQVLAVTAGSGMAATQVTPSAANKEREVNVALYEAWQWLVLNSLIRPAAELALIAADSRLGTLRHY